MSNDPMPKPTRRQRLKTRNEIPACKLCEGSGRVNGSTCPQCTGSGLTEKDVSPSFHRRTMGLVRLCALVAVSIFAGSIEASEFKPEFRFNHTAETPRLEIAWTVEEAPRGFKYVYDVLEWLTEDDDDPGLWFLVYEGLEADVGFELVAYERSGAPQRFGRVVRRLVPINTPRTKPATFAVRDWWVNICDT